MAKILRKSWENYEDGIQARVYKINSEGVIHFNQFTPVQLEKILRKSQAQFRKKLRKYRLRKMTVFL